MVPEKLLPYVDGFKDADDYVDSLLDFLTTSHMLRTLCGGVHILDFMTRQPDLYSSVLPLDWREWLENVDIMDLLELMMRDDLESLHSNQSTEVNAAVQTGSSQSHTWRGYNVPPESFVEYISAVRRLSLDRSYKAPKNPTGQENNGLSRRLSVGMKPKKAHEVENFAAFVNNLAININQESPTPISHFLDFGSGQNYLGRVLASSLYSRKVIAVERKHHNVDGAKRMDVSANLAKKVITFRNKKQYRNTGQDTVEEAYAAYVASGAKKGESVDVMAEPGEDEMEDSGGKILHVEHDIQDGNLDPVVLQLSDDTSDGTTVTLSNDWDKSVHTDERSPIQDRQILCISLHSCGNLSHHGIRSLVLNPFVRAVALIGCCYNLLTERLGPPTYKLPVLRSANTRLEKTSSACDPHGFPMSEKMANLTHNDDKGIRLNITARMMAVQAPYNWGRQDCDSFFTRHFYRALLQRLFLDRGFVKQPTDNEDTIGGVSPAGFSGGGEPIILGSLRKSCYTCFVAYVRGALEKLKDDPVRGQFLQECMKDLTDEEIVDYEQRFQKDRHHLSIVWSLMAFSANVIESAIATDRWLYLREQKEVRQCWVQTVFDYKQSPRNLVVVGVK
jgi:hypothetical protein